jgi:hypothetical protein
LPSTSNAKMQQEVVIGILLCWYIFLHSLSLLPCQDFYKSLYITFLHYYYFLLIFPSFAFISFRFVSVHWLSFIFHYSPWWW